MPSNGYNVRNVLFSPDGKYVYAIGSSPVSQDVLLRVHVKTDEVRILRAVSNTPVDKGYLSEPEKITFPTGHDKKSVAYGYLYLPKVCLCHISLRDIQVILWFQCIEYTPVNLWSLQICGFMFLPYKTSIFSFKAGDMVLRQNLTKIHG